MIPIGIDTSVIIGLLDSRDLWHNPALDLLKAITSAKLQPVYFDCILAEAISTISRRLHEKHRTAELSTLLKHLKTEFPSKVVSWTLPEVPRLYDEVLELIEAHAGELNFNDCLLALVCREQRIPALASFDQDFDKIPWLLRLAEAKDVATLTASK